MGYLDHIRPLTDLQLDGKRVFVRVDFNVPIKGGQVTDDFRIREALPTIQHVIRQGGRPILASHLGRPKRKPEAQYSLAPVAERLAALLPEREVVFADDCVGDGVRFQSQQLQPGQILLLENLRFHGGEEDGDERFAAKLGELADVYINDAFGTCHRAHASMSGMVSHFGKEKGAGFLVMKEIENLGQAIFEPARPFVAILGGAKVSDKIAVIESLLSLCDTLCIGGAMAYTFLGAQHFLGDHLDRDARQAREAALATNPHTFDAELCDVIGTSLVERDRLALAARLLRKAATSRCTLLLPSDHVTAPAFQGDDPTATTPTATIPPDVAGFDIGPQTVAHYRQAILNAKTVFWNGPLGVFEQPRFAAGTRAVAEALAQATATARTIIGGGDSAAAINAFGLSSQVTHVSTGGGASLELVEGKKLPGIEALRAL
jgi:phosphoglycerate kinase